MTEFTCDPDLTNKFGKTPLQLAQKLIKDPHILETVEKLLTKKSTSTKVVKNRDKIEEKKLEMQKKHLEAQNLRNALKAKLSEQNIDLDDMFKKFDKNGDGVFSYLEFEVIFTVLDIQFSKDQLRRLIELTDSNQDGRIDVKEFHKMLYSGNLLGIDDDDENADLNDSIEMVEELSAEDQNSDDEKLAADMGINAKGRQKRM